MAELLLNKENEPQYVTMNIRICPISWSLHQQALSELAHTRNTDTCLKWTTAYMLMSRYSLWANDLVFSFLLIFKFHLQS